MGCAASHANISAQVVGGAFGLLVVELDPPCDPSPSAYAADGKASVKTETKHRVEKMIFNFLIVTLLLLSPR
jgi:hypothetical protein